MTLSVAIPPLIKPLFFVMLEAATALGIGFGPGLVSDEAYFMAFKYFIWREVH